MKKLFVFSVFLVASIIFLFTFSSKLNSESNLSNYQNNFEIVFMKYSNIYEALFSLNELRAYSIIQLDKTISMYENQWIAPEIFAALLDNEDKAILKQQIFNYMMNLDNDSKVKLINKLQYWCINDLQINLLATAYDFEMSLIIESMYSMPLTSSILDLYNERGTINFEALNESEINQAYHNALNLLVNCSFKEQINYQSELLANMSKSFN